MRLTLLLLFAALAPGGGHRPVDEAMTRNGPVRLTVIHHASLMIEAFGQVIHIDPAGAGHYDGLPPADLILVTHAHEDHFDPALIGKLRKSGTVVVAPPSVGARLREVVVLRNGESRQFREWTIDAFPAYSAKGDHPKGEGNGYILTSSMGRCYIAGDTGAMPEMNDLRDIMVAFLPVDATTMSAEEAARAVLRFRPAIVYPYHTRGGDVSGLEKALASSDIQLRLRDWYY